jgi:acyl carrier protein
VGGKIKPLSFEEFQALVAQMLETTPEQITPQAYFVTDLGVDSVRLVELLLRMQDLGLELTPDLAWRIQTVQDAYQYYQEQAGL